MLHASMNQPEGKLHKPEYEGRHVCWHEFPSAESNGPPLVLLHGGHGNWQHWARNIDALAERFTVWAPDMPGYGESDTPPEPTLPSMVGLILATLNQLVGTATSIRLVGFSFGGFAAATLAAAMTDSGQRVERMALLGPGGHGGPRRPAGELVSWRAAKDAGDAVALEQVMRHNLAMHMLHNTQNIDAEAVRIHTQACLQTRFYSKAISHAGGLPAALARYPGPLLLAWGEHDVTAVAELAARTLSDGRLDCETHIVPGAGHWVQFEGAGVVNQLLLGWLR